MANSNSLDNTYPFAIAQVAEESKPRSGAHNDTTAYNAGGEAEIVVPTASAQVLPDFGNSAAPLNSAAVATSAVATAYTPDKASMPISTTTTTQNNGYQTTTTVTHYPAGTAPTDFNNNNHTNNNSDGLPSHVSVRLARMKRHRKARQAVAATAGAIGGFIVLGPIGAAIGGVVSHAIVKGTGRAVERRVRRRYQLQSNITAVATPVRTRSQYRGRGHVRAVQAQRVSE